MVSFWPVLNPGTTLKRNWHIGAICEHLEAVSLGQIHRLVINIPPRHLKSTICSVMWPAWEWLDRPSEQWLTASNDLSLATRDARFTRQVIQSDQYQSMIRGLDGEPTWELQWDQNVKTWYQNTVNGHRNCVSIGSKVTGKGGTRGLIDDPHDAKQIDSNTRRKSDLDWFDTAFSSRMNDPEHDPIVLIMQRLHEKDMCGHVLAKGEWEHLCIPTLYEPDHPLRSKTSLCFVDPRTEPGEMLDAERFGPKAIAQAQRNMREYGFAGQHQQRPAPKRGGLFDRDRFQRFKVPPLKFDQVVASWDCAVKGREQEQEVVEGRSFVHGSVWGFSGANAYLLEECRGQWWIDRTIEEMKAQRGRWPSISKTLVEDKAAGPSVMRLLRNEIPGLIAVEPNGSKIQRALAVTPFVNAGNVWVPDDALGPWVNDWLTEICGFPNWACDDRVDTMSQVLIDAWVTEAGQAVRRFMQLTEA